MPGRPAVFLDRDGVINENREDYVKSWDEFVFLPGVFEALRKLARNGWLVVVTSNQSAINRGLVSRAIVDEINHRMMEAVERHGGRIEAVLYCPHRPDENCSCRKPRPGLLLEAARRFNIGLSRSYLVGDALSDIAAGLRAGCQSILVLTGRGEKELNYLVREGYVGYHVVADLREAVDWILAQGKGER